MNSPSFNPYHRWLGIPPSEQPADYYRLLGVGKFESDPDVIEHAVDRQMAHIRTFQLSGCSEHCQKILNELAAARVCLLNPERKAAYDEQLRGTLTEQRVAPPCPVAVALSPADSPASNDGLPRFRASSVVYRAKRAKGRSAAPSLLLGVVACALLATLVWIIVEGKMEQSPSPAPRSAPSGTRDLPPRPLPSRNPRLRLWPSAGHAPARSQALPGPAKAATATCPAAESDDAPTTCNVEHFIYTNGSSVSITDT